MPSRPNIVWLTVDSIRYDRTSVAGWKRNTTPNLARIAAEGLSFSNCIAHGIWSLSSAASILSGTYPSFHKVGQENETLPAQLETIPETFSRMGYTTVGLSANPWFSPGTGLDRGFDTFEHLDESNVLAAGVTRLVKYLLQLNRHSGGYTTDMAKNRSEYLTMGLVRRHLDRLEGRNDPFLLYAHTEGAHTPYYPPSKSLDTFASDISMDPHRAREFVYDVHQNLYREIARGLGYTDDEWRALGVMYDTLIRYVDEQVGKLFDYVQSLDLGPTIVVITADHGDLLGEHGLLSHKVSLHDGIIHVPLIVHGFDELSNRVDEIVQHSDLLKTLISVAGGDAAYVQGENLLEGHREFALAQRGEQYYQRTMEKVRSYDPEFDASQYHETAVSAIRSDKYKYIESGKKSDLVAVDDEEEPIGERRPDVADSLQSALHDRLAELGAGVSSETRAEFTDDMRRRLDDLGYL